MSSNICGNCENFKPSKNERFFNCTAAKHAGVSYGMQVRADTRACDAFLPYKAASPASSNPPPVQKSTVKSVRKQPDERPRPSGLCPWGRGVLIAALIIIILIIAGLAYICASNLSSSPGATPTPTIPIGPPVGPTPPPGPTPTPVPIYEFNYYPVGQDGWAMSPTRMVLIPGVSRLNQYWAGLGVYETAPPGMIFIFINVTVVNRSSTTPLTVVRTDFYLTDADGYAYATQTPNKPYYVGNPFGGTIQPGKSINGSILYLVPIPAKGFEISYMLDAAAYPAQVAKWQLPW